MADDASSKYMLDTNVFNAVADGTLTLVKREGATLLATFVQRSELENTKDQIKRSRLIAVFDEPVAENVMEPVLAESWCFDIGGAGFDQAKWNDGSGQFDRMLQRLLELDQACKKVNSKRDPASLNQKRDIVIAETALKNDCVLITDDINLQIVYREFHGIAMGLEKFRRDMR